MREENYFEKKLETSRETLSMAENQLEHLDIQISNLKLRFDHDLKVYNDQIIHMQKIVKAMKENIPLIEKKIKDGYTSIDMKTGKAYKSFKDRHIGQLKEKVAWTLENQEKLKAIWENKQTLKKKKREKLKPEELEIVEAEEIRESLQGKDEIVEAHEKRLEQLQKKADFYKTELETLKEPKPEPDPVIFDAVGNIITKKPEETIAEILDEKPKNVIIEDPAAIKIPIPDPSKQICPECKKLFTKGGAFAAHYKSHFPNGNGKV